MESDFGLAQLADETAKRLELPLLRDEPSRKYWHRHPQEVLYSRFSDEHQSLFSTEELLAVERARTSNCKVSKGIESPLLIVQIAVPCIEECLASMQQQYGTFTASVAEKIASAPQREELSGIYASVYFLEFTVSDLRELFSALYPSNSVNGPHF